ELADEILERAIDEEATLEIAHPDQHRRAVGQQFETRLALADRLLGALQFVDIDQQQHGAVDDVLERAVGTHAHQVPPTVAVLHLALADDDVLDHLEHEILDVVAHDVELDIGQGPPDVAWNHVEELLRGRGESSDAQVAAEHHDRDLDAREEVGEV